MCGRCSICTGADNKTAPAEMPGLLSWQELHKVGECAPVAVFDAVGGAIHFLGNLLKRAAVEDLAAEDAPIQLVEDVLIDERAHLGTGKSV